MRLSTSLVAAVFLAACSSREAPEGGRSDTLPPQADSLVLIMPDSAEIWYTVGMLDTAATGESCHERNVEIRRGQTTTPVPLLYTYGGLEIVDDTTVRAPLIRDCSTVDTYLVNTRTGQPRRVE